MTAARAVMKDEQAHVILLRQALGRRSVSKPAINLDALGIGLKSQNEFLTLARAFEDVGVSAYGGAAPLIRDADILATAARILATEAEHTGILRLLVSQTQGLTVSLLDSKDILPLGSPGARLVSADDQGLTPAHSVPGAEHRLRRQHVARRLLPERRQRCVQHRVDTGVESRPCGGDSLHAAALRSRASRPSGARRSPSGWTSPALTGAPRVRNHTW